MSKRPPEEIAAELEALRNERCGRFARHVKTGGEYLINGFVFNACTDQIDVIYLPWDAMQPAFSRNWAEFCDGRFEFLEAGK